MTSTKGLAIIISAGLAFSLAAPSVLAETYLVHFTAEVVETTVRGGGTLHARYSIGEEVTGVFETDSRRTDHVRGDRSHGRGAMQFMQTPKKLSVEMPAPLSSFSYSNGRLLLTGDGAASWSNAEDYCNGYAATRRLFCTASGSIEVSSDESGGSKQTYNATNFSLSLPAGMDPNLKLAAALEALASLGDSGGAKLVLGFSDKKLRADQDRVRLKLNVTSMDFEFK